jgi:hypothetical protein
MFSENVLSEVFSYLTIQDLLEVLKVNKKYRKSASNPLYYKREFTRIFMSGIDQFPTNSPLWHQLCFDLLKQQKFICNLPTDLSHKIPLSALCTKLTDILALPEIPLPKLRKDVFTYPTQLQDMLANINDSQPEPNDFYSEQFKFIETAAFSNTDNFLNFFLRPVSSMFLKVITQFCDAYLLRIQESEEFFISYIDSWEKFSLSIQNLSDFVLILIEKVKDLAECIECKEVYSFCYNFHGFMTNIWKERVLSRLQEPLNSEFMKYFELCFKSGEEGFEWVLCKRYSEAIFDVSIDEFSVHFKNYSKTDLNGPMKLLETIVVEYFEGKRILNEKDFDRLDIMLRIFPAVINRKIVQKLNLELNWSTEYEQYINHMEMQDYIIECMAKGIGISYSDVGFFSKCKSIELVDLLTHVREFKQDICN